jgi:hypothetical protein
VAERDDLHIDEIKKTMTVENYFLLIKEHKMLKNEVEKQNEIIEE